MGETGKLKGFINLSSVSKQSFDFNYVTKTESGNAHQMIYDS